MSEVTDKLIREARFAGPVYLKTGTTSAQPAILARTEEDLVLATGREEHFRVPLSEVEKVEFPWWFFGGGMRVTVAGNRHTLGFSPPAKVEGEDTQWLRSEKEIRDLAASARQSSKQWKAALADVGGKRG